MNAIIFDIDGTLINSCAVDGELYSEAINFVLNGPKIRKDWGDYTHVTDSGIVHEVFADNAIAHNENLVRRIKTRFLDSLSRHLRLSGPFTEIPGARRFLSSCLQADGFAVAYATGGWRESAEMKLSAAGFPLANIPLATSDDFAERVAIMQHALTKLGDEFTSVTYFGDAHWDRKATQQLGWNFQPVGPNLGGIVEYEASQEILLRHR